MKNLIIMILVAIGLVLSLLPARYAAARTYVFTVVDKLPADDNDGVPKVDPFYGRPLDNCPYAPNGSCSTPSNCDVNRDGTVTDAERAASNQLDSDADGVGDACDDSDADGVMDYIDNCPDLPNPPDASGAQDASVCADLDEDGVPDEDDNCPDDFNRDQSNVDEDAFGDMCDNCPSAANDDQIDTDNNGRGDACSIDDDGDMIIDEKDNCPLKPNVNQRDGDKDGVGDVCDEDITPDVAPPPPESGFDDGCALIPGAPLGLESIITGFFLVISVAVIVRKKGILLKSEKRYLSSYKKRLACRIS